MLANVLPIKQLFTDNIISEHWRNPGLLNDNYHASHCDRALTGNSAGLTFP